MGVDIHPPFQYECMAYIHTKKDMDQFVYKGRILKFMIYIRFSDTTAETSHMDDLLRKKGQENENKK